MTKIKITYEGQPCRKCQTPVVDVKTGRSAPKPGFKYGYAGYFLCPNSDCKTMYMDDSRRVYASVSPPNPARPENQKEKLRREITIKMQQLLLLFKKESEL